MKTTLVPAAHWRQTLDDLSCRCDGMLVSLEIVGGAVGAEEQIHNQPLRGITADPTGVSVQIERSGGCHLAHHVADPRRVRIVETDEGAVVAVEIEADSGLHCLVRFRSPVRKDLLDAAVE